MIDCNCTIASVEGTLERLNANMYRWRGCAITPLGTRVAKGSYIEFMLNKRGDIRITGYAGDFPSYHTLNRAAKEISHEE